MKCLKDTYGDTIFVNKEQIAFIESKSLTVYKVYFTNGLDRSFSPTMIEKLLKEEDK